MERLNANVGSTKAALQQRPEVFQPISVYLSAYIAVCVVYYLVHVFIVQFLVRKKLVGEYLSLRQNVFPHDVTDNWSLAIWRNASANFTAALQHPHHHSFVSLSE